MERSPLDKTQCTPVVTDKEPQVLQPGEASTALRQSFLPCLSWVDAETEVRGEYKSPKPLSPSKKAKHVCVTTVWPLVPWHTGEGSSCTHVG